MTVCIILDFSSIFIYLFLFTFLFVSLFICENMTCCIIPRSFFSHNCDFLSLNCLTIATSD